MLPSMKIILELSSWQILCHHSSHHVASITLSRQSGFERRLLSMESMWLPLIPSSNEEISLPRCLQLPSLSSYVNSSKDGRILFQESSFERECWCTGNRGSICEVCFSHILWISVRVSLAYSVGSGILVQRMEYFNLSIQLFVPCGSWSISIC